MNEKEKQTNVTVLETGSERSEAEEAPLPQPSSLGPNARSWLNTDDWWAWEMIGILLSAGSIIAIIGLLARVNNKRQPDWGVTFPGKQIGSKYIPPKTIEISLNSVISWISTIGKICVLIPVTKGLGQLKWVWFAEQERELTDFEKFENATRGLTGSAFLLWRLKGRHFAVIGALAIILALGFDPFIQNLVKYTTNYDKDNTLTAYLASTNTFMVYDSFDQIDMYTKYKINQAFYDFNSDWRTPGYSCDSGNCTWSNFDTLGMCSRCADLTSQLVKTCNDGTNYTTTTAGDSGLPCDYTLPNGMHLDADGNTLMHLNASQEPLIYKNYSQPIAIVHAIGAYDGSLFINSTAKVHAAECALVPCVKTVASSVGWWWFNDLYSKDPESTEWIPVNSDYFREKVVNVNDEYEVVGDGLSNAQFEADPSTGIFLSSAKNESDETPFQLGTDSANAFRTYLKDILAGTVINADGQWGYVDENGNTAGSAIDAIQAIFTYNPDYCPSVLGHLLPGQSPFQCSMANIATAMTVSMRDAQYGQLTSHWYRGMPNVTSGVVINQFPFVHVTWWWIILPIIVWVLSVIMLLGTAWKTRKAGIRTWRTNPLALVFWGLGKRNDKKPKSTTPHQKAWPRKPHH